MSMFTKAGDFLHNNLIETAGSSLGSNLITGASTGAVLDGGISILNGGSPSSSIAKGAVKGAMFHGAYKGLGNQYTKGVTSAINEGISTMTKNTTNKIRSDFNITHFTKTANNSLGDIGTFGKADLKNIPFQNYNNLP